MINLHDEKWVLFLGADPGFEVRGGASCNQGVRGRHEALVF